MTDFIAKAAVVAGLCLVAAGASQSAEDPYATMRRECAAQLKLSSSGCSCIVAKAKAELSEKQLYLVIAHITKNATGIMEKQKGMTGNEMMTVINFLTTAPSQCGNQ